MLKLLNIKYFKLCIDYNTNCRRWKKLNEITKKRIKETNDKYINYSLCNDEIHIRNKNFIFLYSRFNLNEFFCFDNVVFLRILNNSYTSEHLIEWILNRIVKFKLDVRNVHDWLLMVQVQWQFHWNEYQ